jgi:hypothetical protein
MREVRAPGGDAENTAVREISNKKRNVEDRGGGVEDTGMEWAKEK